MDYTKGPWSYSIEKDIDDEFPACNISNSDGDSVIKIECDDPFVYVIWFTNKEDDLRLIAAAPDMYEALKAMFEAFRVSPDGFTNEQLAAAEIAYYALKKAEGRGNSNG